MKTAFVIAVLAALALTAWARPEDEHYAGDFDEVDVKEVLANPRIFNNYYSCFETGEKCVPAANKIKELLPDALQNKCAKCTDVQKDKIREIVHFVIKNHPDKFLKLEQIYDKERKYRKEFAKELKDEGITLPE